MSFKEPGRDTTVRHEQEAATSQSHAKTKEHQKPATDTTTTTTHLPPVNSRGILASQDDFSVKSETVSIDQHAEHRDVITPHKYHTDDALNSDAKNSDERRTEPEAVDDLFSDTWEDFDDPVAKRYDQQVGFYMNTSSARLRRSRSGTKSAVSVASTDPRSAVADVEYEVVMPTTTTTGDNRGNSRQSSRQSRRRHTLHDSELC